MSEAKEHFTSILPEVPLYQLFEDSAKKHADKAAVHYKDQTYTYARLDHCVNCFSAGLTKLGVKQHDRVCLFLPNSPEYIISFFGGLKAGATMTPANPTYTARELEHQCKESQAAVVVTREDVYPVVREATKDLGLQVILVRLGDEPVDGIEEIALFSQMIETNEPAPLRPPVDAESDLATLPFTSGTTGLPKGVMLTHYNMTSNQIQYILTGRCTSADTFLLFLPMYHIYATMLFGVALAVGGQLVVQERFHPQGTLDLIQRHRPTTLALVPPVLVHWVSNPAIKEVDWSCLTSVVSGAAPLSLDLVQKFHHMTGVRVVQGYGLTEASPLTHKHGPGALLEQSGTVGPQVVFTDHRVVDFDTGEELPPGKDGELCVRGPQVMKGYWKHPEATAQVLRDGWLHTGDVAYIDEAGCAVITDRQKDMIKVKGFSVGPAELEGILLTHEGVRDCAVIGIPHPTDGEVPKAFIVRDLEVSAEELMDFVLQNAAKYKAIRSIEFVDYIPKNPSGKILKRVLKEREPKA